jgi:TRAP-type mannitol/chloroaromatic compound transport system permease small subunit
MRKVLGRFAKTIDAVNEWGGRINCYLIFVITVLITIEVTSRYVFNYPTNFVWPMNRQLFGVFILFAGAYALKHEGHVRIEILYKHFPKGLKTVVNAVALVAMLAFLGVLVWQSAWMGLNSLSMGERIPGGFRLPLYPFKLLIPIVVSLFLLQGIVQHFKESDEE